MWAVKTGVGLLEWWIFQPGCVKSSCGCQDSPDTHSVLINLPFRRPGPAPTHQHQFSTSKYSGLMHLHSVPIGPPRPEKKIERQFSYITRTKRSHRGKVGLLFMQDILRLPIYYEWTQPWMLVTDQHNGHSDYLDDLAILRDGHQQITSSDNYIKTKNHKWACKSCLSLSEFSS